MLSEKDTPAKSTKEDMTSQVRLFLFR